MIEELVEGESAEKCIGLIVMGQHMDKFKFRIAK